MPARASICGFSVGVPSKKSMNPIFAFNHGNVTLCNFVTACHFVARVVTQIGQQVQVVLDPSLFAGRPRVNPRQGYALMILTLCCGSVA
jgi:hypothetical protein